ncbi:hypothetical protein KI387_001573 [Taxus chinensis]|uniref:histone deacetylase n=1 Tax=Taxus chinensis TaxID=29808 RepID=A0AA38LP22_TAXCH|nr:hypothetical protein KI387_001573 [Taxus chinensis]
MTNNFIMAAEQNSKPPDEAECMGEKNVCCYEQELEADSDDREEDDFQSSIDDSEISEDDSEVDDEEEDCMDVEEYGTTDDLVPVHPGCLNTDARSDHTQHFDTVSSHDDGMAVESLEGDKLQGAVDVRQNSFPSERDHARCKTFEELVALYEQEGSLEDDEDDKDWSPYVAFAVHTKWFCMNCTMPNLDDSLHCDMCGEHRESGILNQGFLAPQFTSAEVSSSETSVERAEENGNAVSTSASLPISLPIKESPTALLVSERCTAIGFDERMFLHSEAQMKSHPHPERPDRLRAIAASLKAAGLIPAKVFPIPAREVTCEELQRIHSQEHVSAVESTSIRLSSYFTPDTYANEHSACAARVAAGLCADLATAIVTGKIQNGFALVRPPGHHAGVTDVMGFCLHNNAAIAVRAAQAAGAKKVLIVDWDVHHGNGTQEIFERDKSVLYISLHRHEGGRFYPGTGAACEVGSAEGEGYSVNIPWKCGGIGDEDYIFAFQHVVLLIAEQFGPDLTIISAGFDAAKGDPLGGCEVSPNGFAYMTQRLSDLLSRKMLVILEGGYNLRSISASATAVVKVLVGENVGSMPDDVQPSKAGLEALLEVLGIQSRYWPILNEPYLKLQAQWDALYPIQKEDRLSRGHVAKDLWGTTPTLRKSWRMSTGHHNPPRSASLDLETSALIPRAVSVAPKDWLDSARYNCGT